MASNNDWAIYEVELIIVDYFAMLNDELLNKPVNKSFHRRALVPLLNHRSEGSIEFKHQNISAALIKQGLPYIKGYKPLINYQQILDEKITEYLQKKKNDLIPKFEYFAENTNDLKEFSVDFNRIIDKAPEIKKFEEAQVPYKKRPIKINYLEREQQNSNLGIKGEELIMRYEEWRLIQEGKDQLASKIEWISKSDDSAGFDILSKNTDGSDRYIEVKTTKLTKEAPFYFSKNEYEFSKENSKNYHLYRLFNFSETPHLFLLNGDYDMFCKKEAVNYKGFF